MSRFLAGFLTASVLWGFGAAVYVHLAAEPEADEEPAELPVIERAEENEDEPTRRRGTARRRDRPLRPEAPTGIATTGDDLGDDEPRTIDLEAGEERLPSAEIERTMDGAFGRIRRCLILAGGDEPVRGTLSFGMRIEPTGRVSGVNLRGPAAVTTGEAGECLRTAVRAVKFRSFDGPPMRVQYPVTLD